MLRCTHIDTVPLPRKSLSGGSADESKETKFTLPCFFEMDRECRLLVLQKKSSLQLVEPVYGPLKFLRNRDSGLEQPDYQGREIRCLHPQQLSMAV